MEILEKIRTDSTWKTREKEIASTLKAILPCISFAIPIESGHLSETAKALQVQGYKDEYL